jgi:PAS domain S-box-containing protein
MQQPTSIQLNSIPDALLFLDKDGYFTYVSPAVTRITQYAGDELLDQPLSVFYVEKDDTKVQYDLRMASQKGNFVSEGWRIKKDGTQYWGEITIAPVLEAGSTIGYSCLLRDQTGRKKDELNLRKNEELYRLLVEGVRDYSIFMLDAEGVIITWNEGGKQLTGYTADEVIGRHFSMFYTPADREVSKDISELRTARETAKYEEEGWRVKKNGSVYWAHIILTSVFNAQNKLIGYSKVVRDLTERRKHEQALMLSEERYRLLVEQVADYGIFMMDEKGRIISWNAGAKNIKGYTEKEIIGKYFSIFYPEEDIILGKPAMELKIAREVGKYEEEGWRVKKDGTKFWANVVITAVYDNEDVLIGFSKVTRDLTERQKSEKALRDSYQSYRELANQLTTTNQELSYANQELEQFTSIVSHDLQEPIRTIKSFLQLIQIKLNDHQASDLSTYISKSINAANRMRELIQNLLHYSQLSKGEMVEETVDVDELIQQALQNLKTSIESGNAQIQIENAVKTVRGDRVQLVQLIQNLVSNALKFTNSDKPVIIIRCSQENGHLKCSVSDNGIGIDESDLHKVFEIFRRLHTKKDYPGTGIGLAICKKIVDRHAGRIWPESKPGKGTTFYFTLNEQPKDALTA